MVLCLLHYCVMPDFVNFLFSFGFQEHQDDFHFSGFRQRINLQAPTLGQSQQHTTSNQKSTLDICYNFKSVEPSDCDDWSIRNCAIHHSFSVKEIESSWIVVKGDDLMKDRVKSATGAWGPPELSSYHSLEEAFRASMATHQIFCDSAAENWRWYINSLEQRFEHLTSRIRSAPVNVPISPNTDVHRFKMNSRAGTQKTVRSTFSVFSRTQSQLNEAFAGFSTEPAKSTTPKEFVTETGTKQPLPPDGIDESVKVPLLAE